MELDPFTIETIKTTFNNDPVDCFNEVLLDWLKGQGSICTWKNLATALKAPSVKFSSLSEAIEKKYCETVQTGNYEATITPHHAVNYKFLEFQN